MRLRPFNLQHADDAVAGKLVMAGSPGTFDPNLAKTNPRTILAPHSRRPDGGRVLRQHKQHRGGPHNRFHLGAVNGDFSTVGLVALALGAVALWYVLKK